MLALKSLGQYACYSNTSLLPVIDLTFIYLDNQNGLCQRESNNLFSTMDLYSYINIAVRAQVYSEIGNLIC